MEDIKGFITGFIVRWLLKIGGGFFLSIGISNDSITLIISSVVSIVAGLLISIFQHNKAINSVAS
jgi:hypothetical protein